MPYVPEREPSTDVMIKQAAMQAAEIVAKSKTIEPIDVEYINDAASFVAKSKYVYDQNGELHVKSVAIGAVIRYWARAN